MPYLHIDRVNVENQPFTPNGWSHPIREWMVDGSIDHGPTMEIIVRTFSSKPECTARDGWEGEVEQDLKGGQPTGKYKIPTPQSPNFQGGGGGGQAPAQAPPRPASPAQPAARASAPSMTRAELEALCDYAARAAEQSQWGNEIASAFVTAAAGMGLRAPVAGGTAPATPAPTPAPAPAPPEAQAGTTDAILKEAGLLGKATVALTASDISTIWTQAKGDKALFISGVNVALTMKGQASDADEEYPF